MTRFEEAGYEKIVIIEAFEKNYQFLKDRFEAENSPYRVVWGKVQEIKKFVSVHVI